jgi:hypothetical protein
MELTKETIGNETATLWACGRTLAEAGKSLVIGRLIRRGATTDRLEIGADQFEIPSHLWIFAFREDARAVAYGQERMLAINTEFLRLIGVSASMPVPHED